MADPTISQNYSVSNPRNDLSADYVRAILAYNPETGEFRWKWRPDQRLNWNARYAGTVAGAFNKDGCRAIKIDGRLYKAHRLAWLIATGEWPRDQIDHINLDRTDNRFVNIREATNAENQRNTRVRSNSKSGVKGVHWRKDIRKWRVQIRHTGVRHHLGLFDILAEAAEAVAQKRAEFHGDFARVA